MEVVVSYFFERAVNSSARPWRRSEAGSFREPQYSLRQMRTRNLAIFLSLLFVSAEVQHADVRFPRGKAAHLVVSPRSPLEQRIVARLNTYLEKVLGVKPAVLADLRRVPANTPAIVLLHRGQDNPLNLSVPVNHPESFALKTGAHANRPLVVLLGNTPQGLKRAVQKLVLKSRQAPHGLEIPDLELSETPWIAEREYALCPWVPQHVRGAFVNPYADNRMNIWLYSDAQLASYIEMYDWFGFSGAQLMETAYSYSVFGSPEAFQGRQKTFAKLAKENGQNVSLWVWAAEFNGFGWIDPEVVYAPAAGKSAFEDAQVRQAFEKYYNHYAELAPFVDRLIGHFYDPGNLTDQMDVFSYMRLLEQKFRHKNPDVKLAIDSWAAGPDYLQKLVDNGFKNYLLLEISMPHLFKPGQRERLHDEAKRLGLSLGVWGWYTTEYETDQLASLYVNAKVLKEFYLQIRDGVAKAHPLQYWSEMDAHHLNNIYSMYAASQLLWNPERDPEGLLREITEGIWGHANGSRVLSALKLIEDVRSGSTWKTYWWTLAEHRLGTENPADDLRRVESIIRELHTMKPDPTFVPKFPLPIAPETLIELMQPHLRQIEAFAKFRVELEDIRIQAKAGATKDELQSRLSSAWKPIPEYDTWIGTFGQIERRRQDLLLRKMAEELGVTVSDPSWLRSEEANRLLQKLQNMQRARRGEWQFTRKQVNEFFWPVAKQEDRFKKLVEDGSIERLGEDSYRLTNWIHYAR